jgi:hypothetical protein
MLSKDVLSAKDMQSIGQGEQDLHGDQWNTPESRMYCRTVHIRIKNKIMN